MNQTENAFLSHEILSTQSLAQRLISNLESMTKQYRTLLDLVRKEKQILIDAKVEEINEVNFQKEVVLGHISGLDSLRTNFATALAQSLSIDKNDIRLLTLALKIGGAEGDRLRSLHATLELVVRRLSELNKENAFYAETALKNVGAALDNLKESLMGQKTYQSKGKYQHGGDRSGHLVSKEA